MILVHHFNAIILCLTATMLLFLVFVISNNSGYENQVSASPNLNEFSQSKLPELEFYDDYELLKSPPNTAVIFPIFTQGAYDWKGFHDYYSGRCGSCLKVPIHDSYDKLFSASGNGFRILEFLGYEVIDDVEIDKNPDILLRFDKIILLHNEYVTKTEFKAITSHPNVIYLYPNALISMVKSDYSENTITLVRGPGFPNPDIFNGFDWKYDNSEFFNDWECNDWEFYPIENGHMLNCYPETFLPQYGHELLERIKTL